MAYFTRIDPDPALGRGYVDILQAIRDFTRRGQRNKAILSREVLAVMWAEYEKLGIASALKADNYIRARIRSTQVRPDASGRLLSAVKSHPLPTGSGFPAGAVGIANLEALDKGTINPNSPGTGEYWRAQEYGTAAHVGRRLPGYFNPGGQPADSAQFRLHPYFEVVPFQKAPSMLITRPLQPRHFVRDGAAETVAWHTLQEAKIQAKAIAGIRTAMRVR